MSVRSIHPIETFALPDLLRSALIAGVVASLGNLLLYIVARAAGVPFLISPQPGSSDLMTLPVAMVVIATIVPALVAALILAALARFTRTPLRLFQIGSVLFLIVSLIMPMTMSVALSTRLVLALMHVIAGAAIIGGLSRAAS